MGKLIFQAALILLVFTACSAQIKNLTTETVHIQGNCGMCKATIEKAGNVKNISTVDWDRDTKMATLTYDAQKTNQNEILKRIALAGYDSDQFLAPDDVYSDLPACCQYERVNKAPEMNVEESKEDVSVKSEMPTMEMNNKISNEPIKETKVNQEEANLLIDVFTTYFEVKDALVQTDGELAASKSSGLLTAINAVKMEKLPMDVHMVWMKLLNDLMHDAESIANSKDVDTQRSHFINLSKNMYELIKVAKYEEPVYYQFCPMANDGKGANWLSRENVVKNPYYGSQMLSCGKVIETIEKQ
jgi:copper chaperone CopZ